MLNFKRLGKLAVCFVLCAVCLLSAVPVQALSSVTVRPNAVEKPGKLPTYTDAVTSGRLVSYVRLGGYSGSTVIGCLADGTKVEVLGTKNQFYKIDCYDMTGYIAKTQVEQDAAGNYIVRPREDSADTTYLPTYSAQQTLQLRNRIEEAACAYIGVPYVTGGTGRWGFDCSGFTQKVFADAGVTIDRSLYVQLADSMIVAREDLQPGDLVIFSNTDGPSFASHIGIYLGNDQVIHAGVSKGVCIVELSSSYFDRHFQCARRVIISDVAVSATMPSVGSITGSIGAGWRN